MSTIFTGSCVALVTPFKDNKIDFDRFRALIDWHIENGTDAILVAGTTGETSTLTDQEHLDLLRVAGEHIAGRVPILPVLAVTIPPIPLCSQNTLRNRAQTRF